MQKIINNPRDVVDEMLLGYLRANPDIVALKENSRVLKYSHAPIPNKVGLVSGGGSGHKPAFIGYIGRNALDAVAVGEIFTSPPAQMFYDAFRSVDSGSGVACLYGNFAGDNMNVRLAIEMAKDDGIEVKTVVANDDVPSASKDQRNKRRGGAGEVLMWKVGGAKAAQGANLGEVVAVAQKAINNTRSIGIGLWPCTIPEVGHPNFTIEDGSMAIGIGHHGEPGLEIASLESSENIAKRLTDMIIPDLPFNSKDEVVILLSGLGATPVMELYILFKDISQVLSENDIGIYSAYVGNFFTSLDMAGATLTIMKVDDELKDCVDYEIDSVSWKQFGRK